ncbi:MAG: FAD-binding protein [Candidatus Helarchaeota archaeon]
MKEIYSREEISTGILIIGGGISGILAALEAKSHGADVTIISKGKTGKSGNTLISGAGLSIFNPNFNFEDSYELFYKDIVCSGKEINNKILVDCFIKESPKIVDKLTKYGIKFNKIGNSLVFKKSPGHSTERWFSPDYSNFPYSNRGLSLTLPILNLLNKNKIKIIENSTIIKILSNENCICGAVAINKKNNKLLIIKTGVIILAAGGGGKIFSENNNTSDVSSDAYGLAYEAGALLRDMEFNQFYPTMIHEPVKMTIPNTVFYEGATLRNSSGDNFMKNYSILGDFSTRDVMSRAIFTEIINGRDINGCVLLDLSNINEMDFKSKYAELYHKLEEFNKKPLRQKILISPVYHFFIGGIDIDSKGRTNVKGLLSCGESVGGLHGANRLEGLALPEAIVFGMISGKYGAKLSRENDYRKLKTPYFELRYYHKGSVSLLELRKELQNTMWEYCSILRSYNFLEEAKNKINLISQSIEDVNIKNISDILAFYELKNMLITSKLIVKGAIFRKESRGAHYRSDFPKEDNINFKGNLFYQYKNCKMKMQFKHI